MTLLFKVNMSLLIETSLLTKLFYSIIDLLSEWLNLLEDELTRNLKIQPSVIKIFSVYNVKKKAL